MLTAETSEDLSWEVPANLEHDSAETGPPTLTHEILQAQMVVNPSLFKERLETRGERKLWGAMERLSKHYLIFQTWQHAQPKTTLSYNQPCQHQQ